MNYLDSEFVPKTETITFPFTNQHLIIPVQEQAVDFQKVYTVNNTGLELWNMLCKGQSPNSILQYWKEEYTIDESVLRKSILEYLNTLKPILNEKKQQ